MLSFLGFRRDAFEQRRKQQEVWQCIRRIVDRNAPNIPSSEGDSRADTRSNRCLPAMLAVATANDSTWGEPVFAVTKDFSDGGVSLVLPQQVAGERVVCALWDAAPVFMLAEVRSSTPFGGGLWQIGLRLSEIVPAGDVEALVMPAERLNPQGNVAQAAR